MRQPPRRRRNKRRHAVPGPQGAPPAEQTAALATDADNKPKPKLTPKLYYRVVVRDGGTLESAGTVIVLEGIKARAANAQCKDKSGHTWACGARARLALTRLIHGRAVRCAVPVSGAPKSLTARCSVGGKDLSVWMVRPRLGRGGRAGGTQARRGGGRRAQEAHRPLALSAVAPQRKCGPSGKARSASSRQITPLARAALSQGDYELSQMTWTSILASSREG